MHASNFASRPVSSSVGSLMDTSFVRQAACDAYGEQGYRVGGSSRSGWQRLRQSIHVCIAFAARRPAQR